MDKQILFLGYPVDRVLRQACENNFKVASIFVGNGPNCLHSIKFQGIDYLGKSLGSQSDLTEIALLEANIYSILKKIHPEISFREVPLILLAKTP